MANKALKAHKGSNGTGDSLTVLFDRSDPAERRALEAARLLAAKHGRRKSAIIALLEAVYAHYEATGELLSASEISGALSSNTALGRSPVIFAPMVASTHNLQVATKTIPERRTKHKRQRAGGVEISHSAAKGSSEAVAKNFLNSMKSLASGFFD